MSVPTVFNRTPAAIASYDYLDIAAGTGMIIFYAGKETTSYLLSDYTYYSDTMYTGGTMDADGAYHLVSDIDFDVLINKPITIKGNGIVNVPFGIERVGSNGDGYVIAKVRKWDGTTETEIATATSRTFALTAVGWFYSMFALQETIPLTNFKKGEYLRLTVMLYGKTTGTANLTVAFAHDPKNRSAGWDTTGAVPSQLTFQCPTRIDL